MAKPIHLHVAPIVEPIAGENGGFVIDGASPGRVLEFAGMKTSAGIAGAMATVLERNGSAPSTPGQKLFVGSDGSCIGTVGGGAVEREVLAALGAMAKSEEAVHQIKTFKLGAELGMCCGGQVTALLEPLAGLVPCLIAGGGHVATALAPLLAKVGFAVTVVDARDAWGREGRIPGVTCVVGDYDDVGKSFPASTVFLVMTHDHAIDQDAIEWGIRSGFAFVGGVGSRAKAQRTRDRMVVKNFSEEDRNRIRMPIGIDIGARLPDEIAVAIVSELIAWRRQHTKATA